jgi:hypothetical protein
MWFDLPEQQPEIRHGEMILPKEPGFGIRLRAETINRWRRPLQ